MVGRYQVVRADDETWRVIKPSGWEVQLAASPTAFQQAINAACSPLGTRGYDLEVIGGDETTGGAIGLASGTIVFPPMQGKSVRIGAVSLATIQFGACEMVDFRMEGSQTQYVNFIPDVGTPLDMARAVIDSRFTLTTGGPILIDPTTPGNSGFVDNIVDLVELNAGATPYCVKIKSPIAGANVTGNMFRCPHVHNVGLSGVAVQIGDGVPAGLLGYNEWDLVISTEQANATGIATWGTKDKFSGVIDGITTGTTIKLEASAALNDFRNIRYAPGITPAVIDGSTTKDNFGLYGPQQPRASVYLSANQTGIPSGAWTKVLFDAKEFDSGLHFDTTNHRWAPGRAGIARVSARAGWLSGVSSVGAFVAVFKNGSMYKFAGLPFNGAAGDQGAALSVLVPLTAATDYLEVFVYQSTGGTLDIKAQASSAGDETWAMFEMVD